MERLRFRTARVGDAPAVLQLYERLIDTLSESPTFPKWKKGVYPTEDLLLGAVHRGEVLLAERDGGIAGALVRNHQGEPEYASASWGTAADPEEISIIHLLAVDPGLHRQGIAGALLREALRQASEAGQRTVRLDVLRENLPAQALYESLGFVRRGTMELFYEDTGRTKFYLYEFIL